MSDFKRRHFQSDVILWAVRWCCRYGVSYRGLEQMMGERGVPVDHSRRVGELCEGSRTVDLPLSGRRQILQHD